MHAVANILKEARTQVNGSMFTNSIKGFYKGVIPPLLGVTPIFAVSFWGYDVGKKLVTYNNKSTGTGELTMGQMAAAGFISAIPTNGIGIPTAGIRPNHTAPRRSATSRTVVQAKAVVDPAIRPATSACITSSGGIPQSVGGGA